MSNLRMVCAALFVMTVTNAPRAIAFETQYGENSTANGSAQYVDPDEQLEAMADGASGGSPLTYNFGATSSRNQPAGTVTDHSVHWSDERIRMVFGPEAHY
jgi:hypothetical protein